MRARTGGRHHDSDGVEVLGVGDGQVLAAVIMVGDQAGEILAVAVSGLDGLLDDAADDLAGPWSWRPTSRGSDG